MTLILVVDDEAMILNVLSDALEEAGFTITQTMNGKDAISILNDPDAAFAGLVTDVNLGQGISGWDVARAARHRTRNIPVVYVTGDSAHQWPAEGVPNSVMVQKPFALTQVTTAIAQLVTEVAMRTASTDVADPSISEDRQSGPSSK